MKYDVAYTLRIGGAAILMTVVCLGIFLQFGSEIGFYALLAGVPIVVITAAAVYASRSRSTGSTQTTQYFEAKARKVGERTRDLLRGYERLDEQLSNWDTSVIEEEFIYLLDQLEEAGIRFDRTTNRFDITDRGDIRDLERAEKKLKDFREEITDSAAKHVKDEREACLKAQKRLHEVNLLSQVYEPKKDPLDSFENLIEMIKNVNSLMDTVIDDAASELESLAEASDSSLKQVDRGVGRANTALGEGDYVGVTDALVKARNELKHELSAEFESTHSALDRFIDTVESSVVDEYVSPTLFDELGSVREELMTLNSALEVSEVRDLTDRTRGLCTEMIEVMDDQLENYMRTLAEASIPDEFYEYQPANDESYVSKLRSTQNLERYRSVWLNAAGKLSTAIDAVENKAAVAEAYRSVEEDMTEILRKTGRVEPNDLHVKQASMFMDLYAKDHPNITYEPSAPALVAEEFGASYDVSIQAGFDEGGPKRQIDVTLSDGSYNESHSLKTHLLDVVTFDDVPYGKYSLKVTTTEEGYSDAEREVLVDHNIETEVVLQQITLREEVCAGIEANAHDALPDCRDLFESRFEESEHLSTGMDFPIDDEYLPCLLALWAEDMGLTVRRVDGEVLVYDGEQFCSRLSNIVQHNLEKEESISYTEIQNRYLAVPASDNLIADTLRNLPVASEIECGPEAVTKSAN